MKNYLVYFHGADDQNTKIYVRAQNGDRVISVAEKYLNIKGYDIATKMDYGQSTKINIPLILG